MSKVFIIIQARMTSTRLPGKVLLPFGNQSVLETMFLRLKDFQKNIIVATTNDNTEASIVDVCQKNGIQFYRGDTENVLGRYYEAATHFGAAKNDIVVRLTSDCPFIDQTLLDKALSIFKNNQYDMVSLGPHSGFPRGLDTCVFNYALLEQTHLKATHKADREHVTLGMTKFQDLNVMNISAGEDHSHYRITLDEPDDYKMLQSLFDYFNFNTQFSYEDLIQALTTQPEISSINQHVEQKTA